MFGRQYDRTRLGLSLVKAFVRMHDGTIGVQSTPGADTTFEIRPPEKPVPRPIPARGPDSALAQQRAARN